MAYEFVDEPQGRYEFVDEPSAKQSGASGSWGAPMSRADKIGKGLADPIEGAAQLLTNILPDTLVNAGNAANNWLADKTGMVAKIPAGGMNALVKQNEVDYQSKRAAAGESGFDGYRTMGNVISPANLALASKLPVAASLAGRVATGAMGGGASALAAPVAGDDYWSEKGAQAATGAAFGGATSLLTGAVGRMISPNASKNPQLDLLRAEGVKPTIGQTLGGWANRAEEKAQSIPIMGDAISAARSKAGEGLNRAAFNRSLSPIGEKLPMNVKLGNDAVEYTYKRLGGSYDKLLPKLTTQADATFDSSLASLKTMVQQSALDPKYANKFDQIVQTRLVDKFQGNSAMTGETLKQTQEFFTKEIKRYGQSQDPDARLLGDALKEVGSQLNQLVTRSNPKHAAELKAINTGYAAFKRVQKAAGYLGAEDGVFTPAQLQGAVKAADFSKDKARFAEGNAFMQDLSAAGKNVLNNKVPDSGTATRLMMGAGGLASGALNPAIPAGLLGGAAMYSPQMQSLLRSLASSRPQGAQSVAQSLNKAAPLLVPGGAQMGLGLLN